MNIPSAKSFVDTGNLFAQNKQAIKASGYVIFALAAGACMPGFIFMVVPFPE